MRDLGSQIRVSVELCDICSRTCCDTELLAYLSVLIILKVVLVIILAVFTFSNESLSSTYLLLFKSFPGIWIQILHN